MILPKVPVLAIANKFSVSCTRFLAQAGRKWFSSSSATSSPHRNASNAQALQDIHTEAESIAYSYALEYSSSEEDNSEKVLEVYTRNYLDPATKRYELPC